MIQKPRSYQSVFLIILFFYISSSLPGAVSWDYSALKGLDQWGDCGEAYADLVAVYGKQTDAGLAFRADLMNIEQKTEDQLLILIDFTEGGQQALSQPFPGVTGDLSWDLMIRFLFDGT